MPIHSLVRLATNCTSVEQFIQKIIAFPHIYLRTDEERRMTKKDFRELYGKIKTGVR